MPPLRRNRAHHASVRNRGRTDDRSGSGICGNKPGRCLDSVCFSFVLMISGFYRWKRNENSMPDAEDCVDNPIELVLTVATRVAFGVWK
jgi:hypothetical protein